MTDQETYQTEIQNYLIANAESDINIVKHKIDDMKEEYRQFDDEADFAERLEKLYIELGNHQYRLTMIKMHPYNSPLQTNTSNRNPSWVVSETNSDPNFAVGYKTEDILDYGLDRLNRDV
tara:strand:+ start:162 stop:521 length:360 start_codon:yes stop_codon:yes gene_type:complete